MNNRKHNSKNPYQGSDKKVLCVCSAGLLRSPTAANVIHRDFCHNTRAAGLDSDFALIPVDDVLIHWADEIVCMNYEQKLKLMDMAGNKTVINLDIPDEYEFMNVELQNLIYAAYKAKQND